MKEIKDLLFDGTNEEFCQLVESYKMLLYSVVYAASAYADADDIVQETFIYAYYHWGALRDKEKVSSWLCAIAKNKAARAMKTKGNTFSFDEVEKRLSVSSPEASFLHQERREEIRAKIGELSEIYREPIMLYYFAKKNVSEVSEILGISKEVVKFRLYEGRKRLKKELLYMMDEEQKHMKEKNVWTKIENELHRAKEAYAAFQIGEANAICDTEKTESENNFEFCGVHDFFYAPNVGLVQMHFKAISGTEYTVKLKEYEVKPVENGDLCDRYFPLTVGNVWCYEPYGPAVKRFENEYYESRYEVVAKRRNDTLTEYWLLSPEMKTGKDDDVVTMLAHSGWLIKK